MRKILAVGNPGPCGGANVELNHTLRIWRQAGLDVSLMPTWESTPALEVFCKKWDIPIILGMPNDHQTWDGWIVVSFCNSEFLKHAFIFKDKGAKLVWSNCMCWVGDAEQKVFTEIGPFDLYHFQSFFQAKMIHERLPAPFLEHEIIRGAFDITSWDFSPREHIKLSDFVVGRCARADLDKWSSNTWKIYERIPYPHRKAILMGVSDKVIEKIGPTPEWGNTMRPASLETRLFFRALHCYLTINGGAMENWPRVGLEAMAAGVPIVTQNQWGWQEMIVNDETGYLCDSDEEMAYRVAQLAWDESLRQSIVRNARQAVMDLIAPIGQQWVDVFTQLST